MAFGFVNQNRKNRIRGCIQNDALVQASCISCGQGPLVDQMGEPLTIHMSPVNSMLYGFDKNRGLSENI